VTTVWAETPLGEVAEFVRGVSFKPADVMELGVPGSVACLRTANVQEDLELEDVWAIPEAMSGRPDQRLRAGDVIVSSANSWNLVGKCAWVGELPWPATFGGFVTALRASSDKLDARYLYRWFSSPLTQAIVRRFGRKTTNISNLNLDQCRSMLVPLPPIEEQLRIAAILDAADELRAKRRESLALLDSLADSIFVEEFGRVGRVPVSLATHAPDLPDGWAWEPLVNVAELATGHTPDREVPEYWDGDIPWISLTEIRSLDGMVAESTDLRVTQEGIDNSSSVVLPEGTVCFSRTASIGFVTVMGRPMSTSQDFVNWVCSERLNPMYLMHAFLRSREQLRAISTGSTHKTIYMRVAEQFHVLVPPLGLQEEFAEDMQRVAEHKGRVVQSVDELLSLFASLQHRAFRGEL
jgi:type I restriction enzyme S subunit